MYSLKDLWAHPSTQGQSVTISGNYDLVDSILDEIKGIEKA